MSTIRYARRGKREEEEEEEEEGEKMATHSTTSPPEMVGINHVKTERERERRERERLPVWESIFHLFRAGTACTRKNRRTYRTPRSTACARKIVRLLQTTLFTFF